MDKPSLTLMFYHLCDKKMVIYASGVMSKKGFVLVGLFQVHLSIYHNNWIIMAEMVEIPQTVPKNAKLHHFYL